VAIWRGARNIARAVAPDLEASDGIARRVAPPFAMVQMLELAIIFATILLLLAAIAPFVRPAETIAMLLVAVVIIGTMIWRSARAIQSHLEEVSRSLTAMRSPRADMADADLDAAEAGDDLRDPLLPVRIPDGASVIGKTLADLNLAGVTGAAVVALARDGAGVMIPEEAEVLRPGDTLALVGPRDALAAARKLLHAHST